MDKKQDEINNLINYDKVIVQYAAKDIFKEGQLIKQNNINMR